MKRSCTRSQGVQLLAAMKVGESVPALVVDIQVVARASRVAVGPALGDRLRVAVTAPPVDGAANAAVIDALARAFGVRRAGIAIVRGLTGKKKSVRVAGATRAALDRLMAAATDAAGSSGRD